MAVQTFVSIPAQQATITATLAGASSAEIILGQNVIFEIVASAAMNVAFGVSGMAAASASNFQLPANVIHRWDTGNYNDRIRIFGTGTYWIQVVTKLDK